MNKSNWKLTKWLGLGGALLTPLFIAVACGETNDSIPPEAPISEEGAALEREANAYLEEVIKLKPLPSSTHSALAWDKALPPLSTQLSQYYEATTFSDGSATTPSTKWSVQLPSSVPVLATSRALSVRLVPRVNNLQLRTLTKNFPAHTFNSVKVDVARLESYVAPSATSIKLLGPLNNLRVEGITLSAEVSTYLKWSFFVKGQVFADVSAFNNYLRTNVSAVSQVDLDSAYAQLSLVIPNNAQASFTSVSLLIDTSAVKSLFSNASIDAAAIVGAANAYLGAMTSVQPLATSTHNNVTWNSYSPLSTLLATYYEAPQFTTSLVVNATSVWSANLPQVIDSDFALRKLTARLVPKANSLSLTTLTREFPSSALSEVKTDVTKINSYVAPVFANLKLLGATLNDLRLEGASLSAEVAKFISWKFTIKNEPAMSATSFITYLKANVNQVSETDLANSRAELSLISNNPRVIYTSVSGVIDASAVSNFFVKTPAIDVAAIRANANSYLDQVVLATPTTSSTHANLTWSALSSLPASLTPYYEAPDFTTSLVVSSASTWARSLPTSIDSDFALRKLTARLVAKTNTLGLVMLTREFASSTLSSVRTDVDKISAYVAPVFANLKLLGTSLNDLRLEGISLSAEVAKFISWKFVIKNEAAKTVDAYLSYLKANVSTISEVDLANSRAELSLANNDARLIYTAQSGAVDTSAVSNFFVKAPVDATVINSAANAYLDAVTSIQPTDNSTHNDITWKSQGPTMTSQLATYYEPPQYAVSALVNDASVWASSLPTTLSSDFTMRKITVRLVAKSNAIGLTTLMREFSVGKLSAIKTDVVKVPTYVAPVFANLKVVGTSLSDLRLEGVALSAEVAKLISWKFTIKNEPGKSAESYISYLKANANSISEVDLANSRAEISAVDNDGRIIFTAQQGAVDTSAVARFFATAPVDADALKTAADNYLSDLVATQFSSDSTHAALTWSAIKPLPATLAPYYASESTSFTTAPEITSSTAWTSNLPTSIASDPYARKLAARLVAKTNTLGLATVTKSFSFDRLSAIKVDVARLATYSAPIFTNVALVGQLGTPFFRGTDLGAEVSQYISWKFSVNGGTWFSGAKLVEYLTANATTITSQTLSSIRAELSLTTPNDARATFVTLSGVLNTEGIIGFFTKSALQITRAGLIASLKALKIKPESLNTAVTWDAYPTLGPELSALYEDPIYCYLEFAFRDGYFEENKAYFLENYRNYGGLKLTTQPPTYLNRRVADQFLFVVLKAKPGAVGATSEAIDITASSNIKNVRVDMAFSPILNFTPVFSLLANEGVSVSALLSDPNNLSVTLGANLRENPNYDFLRDNANVEYQVSDGPWQSEQVTREQILRDYLNFDAKKLRSINWRLTAKNNASFGVSDITPRPIKLVSASYPSATAVVIDSAIQAEIDRLKSVLDTNVRIVQGPPTYFDQVFYQFNNVTFPGDSAPTRLSLNAAPFTSSLRERGPQGQPPLVTLYWRFVKNGEWLNTNDLSKRSNYFLPTIIESLARYRTMEFRLDYNTNSRGLISEVLDYTISSGTLGRVYYNLDKRVETIEAVKAAFSAIHVKPNSTSSDLQWPQFPLLGDYLLTKTAYFIPEYSIVDFASPEVALTSPAYFWELNVAPSAVPSDKKARHLWVRLRTDYPTGIPVTNEVPIIIDLTESSGIKDVVAD